MRKILIIALAVGLVLPLSADAGNRNRDRLSEQCSLNLILKQLPEEHLGNTERSDLIFAREEEKLARDVYLSLFEQWELKAFKRIARSEKTHMKAVRTLIRKYDLDDPAKNAAIGVFQNSTLQALYADLVSFGSTSLVRALTVGVLIEEMDIADLERMLSRTNNEDTRTLYQNLLRGSRNHLRKYAALLDAQNADYTPEYLSPERFAEIVSSPKEKGGVLDSDGSYICGTTRHRSGAGH